MTRAFIVYITALCIWHDMEVSSNHSAIHRAAIAAVAVNLQHSVMYISRAGEIVVTATGEGVTLAW